MSKEVTAEYRVEEFNLSQRVAYLYRIRHIDTGVEVYATSHDQTITVLNPPANWTDTPQNFISTNIAHDRTAESSEDRAQAVTLSLIAQNPDFSRFFITAPTTEVELEIFRTNITESPDYQKNIIKVFHGDMLDITFQDQMAAGTFMPRLGRSNRSIPRIYNQRLCNHFLGDEHCGVDLEALKETATITSWNRSTRSILTTIGNDTKKYSYGRMVDDDTNLRIGIVKASGSAGAITLYLQYWLNELEEAGRAITVYPGCNFTTEQCNDDYSNLANFLGFPYIPVKNPGVDGTS